MSNRLNSLSIFFPFYNDEGTVMKAITLGYKVGNKVTKDLEVIAIHGGESKDKTWQRILQAKKRFPDLVVINKHTNKEGYAVIKHGFLKATKEWIFYTDGDLQHDVEELPKLIEVQKRTNADFVNGYKINRGDSVLRTTFGKWYAAVSGAMFNLPIRDTDCDFRLIRKDLFKNVTFKSTNSAILPEMLVKFTKKKAKFAEVPISHFPREYGVSNYSLFSLLMEKVSGDLQLWFQLRKSTA